MSPLAVVAFSATHMGLAGHPVPGLEIFYALSHFYNLSGPFVSHNKGIVGGPVGKFISAVNHFGVGTANGNGFNPA